LVWSTNRYVNQKVCSIVMPILFRILLSGSDVFRFVELMRMCGRNVFEDQIVSAHAVDGIFTDGTEVNKKLGSNSFSRCLVVLSIAVTFMYSL